MKRKTYHHGDLKRALIEATLELLKTGSAEALTLREVARRVGVHHAASYRHFEDKAALLAAVAEQGYQELGRAVEKALAARSAGRGVSRLRAFVHAYVEFALTHPEHFQVMMGPRLNVGDRFPDLEAAVVHAYGLLLGEVKRAIADGELAEADKPEDHVITLWMSAHGFATLVLRGRIRGLGSRAAALRYLDVVVEPILRGLGA